MKRTSLSSNFTYWPPPPRASFDDDRDLDAKANQKIFDMEHWEMIDGCDDSGLDLCEEEDEVEMEKRWIGFEVEQCPPSLKLLVRIFRFFYFSFSGIVFKTPESVSKIPPFSQNHKVSDSSASYPAPTRRQSTPSQLAPPPTRRSIKSRFISYLNLTINFLTIIISIFPLVAGPFDLKMSRTQNTSEWTRFKMQPENASAVAVNSTEYSLEQFHRDDYWNEFAKLKPILRHITTSTFYIFMIDGILQHLLNFIIGGRLISRITRIPNILKYDPDYKLGLRILAGTWAFIFGFCLMGICIFNQRQLKTLLDICLGGGLGSVSKEELFLLGKTWLMNLVHQYNYFVMSMVSMIFVYTMIVCRRIIEDIRQEVVGGDLTETQLYSIKSRLTTLSIHFTGIINYLALPVTVNMIANALLLVATSCFMLLHTSPDDFFIAFVFNLAAFSFSRLVIVCAWGNSLTNAHRELVREIYESVHEWSLTTWMDFLEIKRMEEKFEVNIGGVYSVKQSAILTVLGFALNYIVILLQTENYSGREAGLENETQLINLNESIISWSMNDGNL